MLGFALKPTVNQSVSADDSYHTWHREDRGAIVFRTSKHGGPRWDTVTRRATMDMGTGKVVEDLHIDGSNRLALHGLIPLDPRDIKTPLYYRTDRRSVQTGETILFYCCRACQRQESKHI